MGECKDFLGRQRYICRRKGQEIFFRLLKVGNFAERVNFFRCSKLQICRANHDFEGNTLSGQEDDLEGEEEYYFALRNVQKLILIIKTNNIMGLMKVFSGSEILATALQQKIEAVGVDVVVKNNIQSARLGGFGNSDLAVELFVQETEFAKVNPVIEEFRMSI